MSSVTLLTRDNKAQRTRQQLLESAQREIHRVGFQAASLDRILSHAGVTKGALYHHFPSKLALGHAVVDEWLKHEVTVRFITPLDDSSDPITAISQTIIEQRQLGVDWLKLGCPLASLAQEMTTLDDGFQSRISDIYRSWRQAISNALVSGQLNGNVRRDISPDQSATLIVAAIEGTLLLGKVSRSTDEVSQFGLAMIQYLQSLRTPNT